MKRKAALLAAILVSVAAPVVAAEKSGADKPLTSHGEEKTDVPAGEHKLDFKELFGCEPMGENGHTPRPVSGVSGPGAMQPAQERAGEALK